METLTAEWLASSTIVLWGPGGKRGTNLAVEQDSGMHVIFNSKFPPKVYACAMSHHFCWTTNWKISAKRL